MDLANRLRAQGANGAQIRNALEDLRRSRTVLPDTDRRVLFPLTRPTGRPGGGNLTGAPETSPENANSEQRAGTRGQNEAIRILDRAGYRVHQNPNLSMGELHTAGLNVDGHPDVIIEGRVFDVHTPSTSNVHSLRGHLANKIGNGQANRLVVNLSHTSISRAALARELRDAPIPDLREVITIDQQGRIGHAFP